MSDIKSFLLAKIFKKLNPRTSGRKGYEKKIYISERCSEEEYLSLFPNAKKFIFKKGDTQFCTSRKRYEESFKDLKDLESVFGTNWDVVFNGTAVGCVLPGISFRFVSTEITSFKSGLNDEVETAVVQTHKMSTINITMWRAAFTRIGKYDEKNDKFAEAKWQEKIIKMQRIHLALCKRRAKKIKKRLQ